MINVDKDAIQRCRKLKFYNLGQILYPKMHKDRDGMKYANTYLFANCFTVDQWQPSIENNRSLVISVMM